MPITVPMHDWYSAFTDLGGSLNPSPATCTALLAYDTISAFGCAQSIPAMGTGGDYCFLFLCLFTATPGDRVAGLHGLQEHSVYSNGQATGATPYCLYLLVSPNRGVVQEQKEGDVLALAGSARARRKERPFGICDEAFRWRMISIINSMHSEGGPKAKRLLPKT
ncbi:hypothetical protein BX600DRAFT_277050 [Xylariales sp. PMI_506]|nr:hypothetical protein BX600DRAFT_277050 [Xylariales sp. PMI_506]